MAMVPRNGGPGLPDPPIIRTGDRAVAIEYLKTIEGALERSGWSPSQRRRLHYLRRVWQFRVEGRDPVYERHGTMWRPLGASTPTVTDMTVAKWRKQYAPQDEETRKKRRFPLRFKKKYNA